ncbi:MAG: chorismate synthase [Marinifilaceae bacterium]|nr:chorismate synthase [Marinifilaceae bacterium]
MAGNSFGKIYQLTSFGESHGEALGGVVDGCPAGVKLDVEMIQHELDRRRPGQSRIATPRNESDRVEILSGVFEGVTTGMPIAFIVRNENQRSKDYSNIKDIFRPSHADFTWYSKYGIRDYRGGGRSSAREHIARVVAGAIAKQVLSEFGIAITAYTTQIGDIYFDEYDYIPTSVDIEQSMVRCPNEEVSDRMVDLIEECRAERDSIGGVVKCCITGVPVGLGEPVFDRCQALLAHAMLSINAAKGFEYGEGFRAASMRGSEHNDPFIDGNGSIRTFTNHSGGIQGGVTNGETILFNVAFKPVATIAREQNSVNINGEPVKFTAQGRHDPCVVPRAVPVVEAMAAMVILDLLLQARTNKV